MVLVTGATGLLGRQVLRAFQMRPWYAKGMAFSRADGDPIIKADLGNSVEVEKVLDDVKCAQNLLPFMQRQMLTELMAIDQMSSCTVCE
jgi:thioester reductase-like protein